MHRNLDSYYWFYFTKFLRSNTELSQPQLNEPSGAQFSSLLSNFVRELSGYTANSLELFLDLFKNVFNKFPSIRFDINTGEISRFEIKHFEPITNVKSTKNSGGNSQVANSSHSYDNHTPLSHCWSINNLQTQKEKKWKAERNITWIFVIRFIELLLLIQESCVY